mmetsp:Transcript_20035/g.61722  ORF Transcript_20035/g.61722 Transcript_20035/m.61722 type:complete len:193 (+) Transcript_20035:347-925(+)
MLKRLRKESAEARTSTDPALILTPDPDTLTTWTAHVAGPEDTPFAGGVFELALTVPAQYPLAPPSLRFVTPVFHPNVHGRTGEVCLDILKEAWSPAWTLASACTAVRALLAAPNADSPLNCDAGNLIRGGDLAGFEEEARRWVDAHASDGMPERGQAPFPKIAGAADAAPRCPGLATFCVVAVPVVAALIWL